MELKRVVVTGLGAITPIGLDVDTTWQNALDGVSGAGPITHFDASLFKTQFACEVKGFNPANYLLNPDDRRELKDVKRTDLYSQYAIAAAKQAIDDSKLLDGDTDRDEIGVIFASGIGGLHTFEEQAGYYAKHEADGPSYSPFFIPTMIADIAAGHISMRYGLRGPNYGVVSACACHRHRWLGGPDFPGRCGRLQRHEGHQHAQRQPRDSFAPLQRLARRICHGRGRCVPHLRGT